MARLHRLEDREGKISDYRRMIWENAVELNEALEAEGSNLRWKAAAYAHGEPPIKSLIQPMRILDCEGFTPYVANLVDRYSRTTKTPKEREGLDQAEREFAAFMKGKSPEERKIVGRFIGNKMGAAFNSAIRIGLAARLHEPGQDPVALEMADEEPDVSELDDTGTKCGSDSNWPLGGLLKRGEQIG